MSFFFIYIFIERFVHHIRARYAGTSVARLRKRWVDEIKSKAGIEGLDDDGF